MESHRNLIKNSMALAWQRAVTPFSEDMAGILKEARREKIRNKTREKERERKGEVLRATIRRRRKGPPAHILERMSEEERRLDKVARGVSEVGYVGMVKSQMNRRMKDPTLWQKLDLESSTRGH